MPDNSDDGFGYSVGYGKPPQKTQFRSGQSGNPKGRPRGAKNFATAITEELNSKVVITENGKRKKVTKREAVAKQIVNKAAGGDPKAIPILLNETRYHESLPNAGLPQAEAIRSEDQAVMTNIMKRWQLMKNAEPDVSTTLNTPTSTEAVPSPDTEPAETEMPDPNSTNHEGEES